MNRKLTFLVIVAMVGILTTGCLGGGGKVDSTYTLSGSVVERGTENPIAGAEVSLGSRKVTTNAEGNFEFKKVESKTHTLNVNAEGYDSHQQQLNITKNTTVTLELTTQGPLVHIDALEGLTDGDVLDEAKLTISGNINDLLSVRSEMNPLSTGMTISQLQALVNGVIWEIEVEYDGSFEQDVPLDPGSNTIQLRIFDDQGHAGTSSILRVTVSIARIDLRVILSWDTQYTDVDLHMFQRQPREGNVVDSYMSWTNDRHVCWYNDRPHDFGDTEASNPKLDIDDRDGYGPETIILEEAAPGHYHIWIHYFSGSQPTEAKVRIIVDGGTDDPKIYEYEKTLTETWEVWYVGTIVMPSGQLIQVTPAEGN